MTGLSLFKFPLPAIGVLDFLGQSSHLVLSCLGGIFDRSDYYFEVSGLRCVQLVSFLDFLSSVFHVLNEFLYSSVKVPIFDLVGGDFFVEVTQSSRCSCC